MPACGFTVIGRSRTWHGASWPRALSRTRSRWCDYCLAATVRRTPRSWRCGTSCRCCGASWTDRRFGLQRADRALLAALLHRLPRPTLHGLQLPARPDTILHWPPPRPPAITNRRTPHCSRRVPGHSEPPRVIGGNLARRRAFVAAMSTLDEERRECHLSTAALTLTASRLLLYGVRRTASRLICYLALAILLAVMTRSTWTSMLFRPEQHLWSDRDAIFLGALDGTFEEVDLTLTVSPYRSSNTSSRFPDENPDPPGVSAQLVLSVGTSTDITDRSAYLVAQGATAKFLDDCKLDGIFLQQYVPTVALPEEIAAVAGQPTGEEPSEWPPPRRILQLDGFPAMENNRVTCDIDPNLLWAHDRHKHFLDAPMMQILSSKRLKVRPNEVVVDDDSGRVTACPSVVYLSGARERVDTVTPASDSNLDGAQTWSSCEDEGGIAPGYELKGSQRTWIRDVAFSYSIRTRGTVDLTIIDVVQEGQNERNLLLAGLALGVAGAFLVEAVGVALPLVERLLINSTLLTIRWTRRRLRNEGFNPRREMRNNRVAAGDDDCDSTQDCPPAGAQRRPDPTLAAPRPLARSKFAAGERWAAWKRQLADRRSGSDME